MVPTPPFRLRGYQQRVLEETKNRNGIVLLPTGAGKTAVAGEVVRQALFETPSNRGKMCLFLVPTQLLVDQQATFLNEWCGPVAACQYHGEKAFPEDALRAGGARILVSTPAAFSARQGRSESKGLLNWNRFCLLVFDEVHHVLKDHPYRKIALRLPTRDKDGFELQILGLTASLTYALGESQIQAAVGKLTTELRIQKIATATQEELIRDGYHGSHLNEAEMRTGNSIPRPRDESQDLEGFEVSEIDLDLDEEGSGLHPVVDRLPHLMLPIFWQRFRSGKSTAYARALLAQIFAIEDNIATFDEKFVSPLAVSPLTSGKPLSKMAAWGEYAAKRQGVRKGTQHNAMFYALEQWYEALRILASSWETNAEASLGFLKMMLHGEDSDQHPTISAARLTGAALDLICGHTFVEYQTAQTGGNKGLARLKRALLEQGSRRGSNVRGIVFVQQRVTSHILDFFIRQDPELSQLFYCTPLYSASSPATPSLRVTKSEGVAALRQFGSGKVNLLISTSVAEEGMDVPSANCVIRYDPVQTGVSLTQSRGRGRQADSSFVVLAEQPGRDVATLQQGEVQQTQIAADFRPFTPEELKRREAQEVEKQRSRDRGAKLSVLDKLSSVDADGEQSAIARLNEFCKKTKVDLEESHCKVKGSGHWSFNLSYNSLTMRLSAEGTHPTQKRVAQRQAAWVLLKMLKGHMV